jgi:hypothetical protein
MTSVEENRVEVRELEDGTVGEAVANLTGNVIDNALRLAEQVTADGLRVARAASEFVKSLTNV